ncbi:hypothetical protein ACO0LF_31030 [Undibacterium sp. Di27W]|uniref:hypothetical protein n=1 Tax=Undibacterium sp. Di27W TaxID=3413036 RepID=UPI003BF0BDAA
MNPSEKLSCTTQDVNVETDKAEQKKQTEQSALAEHDFLKNEKVTSKTNAKSPHLDHSVKVPRLKEEKIEIPVDEQDREGPNFTSIKPSDKEHGKTAHQAPKDVDFSKL